MTALLTDLSQKDSKFVARKDETEYLAQLLNQFEEYQDLSRKFKKCGDFLEFKINQDYELKLYKANFCKSALCPMCSWRRARQWRKRLMIGLPKSPDTRWLFLTLTIKNRPLGDLANSLDQLNNGWQELQKNYLDEFLKGYIRVIEINRAVPKSDAAEEVCHPHIHALLAIDPNYFSDYYLQHHQWREIWQKSIQEEYLPIVNIKSISSGINPRIISEVAKYTLKPGNFFGKYKLDKRGEIIGINWPQTSKSERERAKADFFVALYQQIYHRRLISSGGSIKQSLATAGSEDDLIGGEDRGDGREKGWITRFSWRKEEEGEMANYYHHE